MGNDSSSSGGGDSGGGGVCRQDTTTMALDTAACMNGNVAEVSACMQSVAATNYQDCSGTEARGGTGDWSPGESRGDNYMQQDRGFDRD